MTLGIGLRTFLIADASIADVVNSERIYPINLPQGITETSVRYALVSGNRPFSSPSGPLELSAPRVQIDTFAPTYAEAIALAELIRKRIDGYKGAMGSVTVQGTFFANERDGYEPESKLYFVSRDYFIWHEEDV